MTTPDLIPMIGARMVCTSQPDDGHALKEELIKELTGAEPILVRALDETFVLCEVDYRITIADPTGRFRKVLKS